MSSWVLRSCVDCQTRGYQLSKEASLVGVFIGNFVHGGILDVVMQPAKLARRRVSTYGFKSIKTNFKN